MGISAIGPQRPASYLADLDHLRDTLRRVVAGDTGPVPPWATVAETVAVLRRDIRRLRELIAGGVHHPRAHAVRQLREQYGGCGCPL